MDNSETEKFYHKKKNVYVNISKEQRMWGAYDPCNRGEWKISLLQVFNADQSDRALTSYQVYALNVS